MLRATVGLFFSVSMFNIKVKYLPITIGVTVSYHPIVGFIAVVESGRALSPKIEVSIGTALTHLQDRCEVRYLN